MLQTERDEYAPEIAYYVLENFFQALSEKNWQAIAEEMGVGLSEVKAVFEYAQPWTRHLALHWVMTVSCCPDRIYICNWRMGIRM